MNVGGPAYHVSMLSGLLDRGRYETLLVTGSLGAREGSFTHLAERYGARLVVVEQLSPELGLRDLRALGALVRIVRRFRPDIVHTHTAKAGTLGRLAARLAMGRGPIVLHTYHGHVLRGYFGPVRTKLYLAIERALARITDRLVGVSQATVDELVELGVAEPKRFSVIPVGLDLGPFLAIEREDGAALRSQLGVGAGECLVLFTGRLVPIKRVDVLLRALRVAVDAGAPMRLIVVGDGPERAALEAHASDLALQDVVEFLGFRDDLPLLAAASDLAALSSDNEGTPVALIEAAAAGRPAVATDVGGVGDIVTADTGILVSPRQPEALGLALAGLAADAPKRDALGKAAREHVRHSYGSERLLHDIEALYDKLLSEAAVRR